jgi:protein gp37
MSDNSGIEWTDSTWNPVTGCTKVSPGCAYCYAEAVTLRFKRGPVYLPGKAKIVLHPDRLDRPLRWRRPRRIFVDSMSDLFHEDVPDEYIDRVFAVMALADHHVFQVLSKRPERMLEYIEHASYWRIHDAFMEVGRATGHVTLKDTWPLPNVWLGVSVENQYWADRRIPLLLQTPAAVRFLSLEPLLKPVDLGRVDYGWLLNDTLADFKEWREDVPFGLRDNERVPPGVAWLNVLTGEWFDGWDSGSDGKKIDWVIVGGESGPKRRPMAIEWVRSLRDECFTAGIPFFYKQPGGLYPGGDATLDGRTWREFPQGENRVPRDVSKVGA